MFTSVDGIVKRDKFKNFIKTIFTDRNILELIKDGFAGIKLLWEILK